MKNTIKSRNLLYALLMLVAGSAYSQSNSTSIFEKYLDSPRWSLGANTGVNLFHGDADVVKPKPHLGLCLKYSPSYRFGVKSSLTRGSLAGERGNFTQYGDDDISQISSGQPYSFENKFTEFSLLGEYNFGNLSFRKSNPKWQHYLFAGLTVLWSETKGGWSEGAILPSLAQNEGPDAHNYSGRNMALPIGVGVRYKLSRTLDLALDYRFVQTRSDFIDGFSYDVMPNRVKDSYSRINFEVAYKFKSTVEKDHLDWVNPIESVMKTIDKIEQQQIAIDELLKDDDKDGVSNYYDAEPNTKPGAKTWGNGETVDLDRDGVSDDIDEQPFSEPGSEVDSKGVMIDRDEDGIPDYRDEEINTPSKAVVDHFGRELDVDRVSESTKTGAGSKTSIEEMIYPSILFKSGSTQMESDAHGLLALVASNMRANPNQTITLTAYAYRNKAASNLGEKRMEAITDYLNSHYSIPRDRINTEVSENIPSGSANPELQIDLR